MPLQTIESHRLYRQIAEQLRTMMKAGEFAVGERLPAERALAQQLGVSRPSVREALIALEVEGWVEIRTGSGVYVLARKARRAATKPSNVASPGWGPLDLIRARRVVEGEVAALAAKLARRKDFDAMADALVSMRTDADNGVMPLDGDRAFHSAIVKAGGNAVLIETVQHFWDARRDPLFARLGGYFETVQSWRAAIEEHENVYVAIRARDAEGARAAMHHHLDKAHSRFSASWRRAIKTNPKPS